MLDREILKMFYDDRLQILVTLHDQQILIVSELRPSPDCRRFEHKVLWNLTVAAGSKPGAKYLIGCHVVLLKAWDMFLLSAGSAKRS